MAEIMDELNAYCRGRMLFSLRRSSVDSYSMQAIALAVSDELVLLQYVRDFQLDGLLVINVGDITSLDTKKTDRFQQAILQDNGTFTQLADSPGWSIESWQACLASVAKTERMIILEEEYDQPNGFTIGRVETLTDEYITMRHFTGAGRWRDDPVEIDWRDITSLQAQTSYIRAYQDYFDRHQLWPDPE